MAPKADPLLCYCGCRRELSGRQEKWASEECKLRHWYALKAEEALASLPQEEFREAIRRVCEKRWPYGTRTNRLKIRFGRYNPRA